MKVLLGIINKLNDLEVNSTFKEKLKNLTDFWIYNATQNSGLEITVEYFNSEQECIDYGIKNDFKITIGSALGHLLRPGNAHGMNVLYETVKLCRESDGLIGHIMAHPGKIPYLYDEYWCLDLDVYREVGSPQWELQDGLDFPNFSKSKENFHDDYTPYYIGPSTVEQHTYILQNKGGTGLIKAWIEKDKKINNFPENIRKLKHHLYPEHHTFLQKYLNGEIEVNELQQELQLEYFRQVDYQHAKECIFLFNTDTLKFNVPQRPIDTLVSVCAAFRPYLILHKSGFTEDTTVKFIDYSPISLQFKQWLISNWDGRGIFEATKQFENQIGRAVNWNKPFHLSYEESYDQVITQFGGLSNWLEFWNQYKKLKHEFHLLDLVDETEKITNLLGEKQNYLYISNSFNTEAGIIKHGRKKLLSKFKRVIEIGLESNSILDSSDLDHHYPYPDFTKNLLRHYSLE